LKLLILYSALITLLLYGRLKGFKKTVPFFCTQSHTQQRLVT